MKLFISDLDGTLYPKKECTDPMQLQKNIAAVRKWVEAGNKFAVATARGLHHVPALTETLGFNVNFIGGNGACVMLESQQTIIKQFPCRIFIDLCRFVKENGINASVAVGLNDHWLWSSTDCYPKGNESYASIWDSVEIANLDEIDPEQGIERVQIFTPAENRDKLKAMILERNYEVTITTSDIDLIDIGPLNCSKGISITEMCERHGIDPEEIIVIGDSENDIPMFEMTKHSYCIDLADSNVLRSAEKIVSSVEEAINLELAGQMEDRIYR